jgi:hypothetical protein
MSFTFRSALNAFEITIEDEDKGGVNLDLMHTFYSIEKIVQLVNWDEK